MGKLIFLSLYLFVVGYLSRGVFLCYYRKNLLYAIWRYLFAIMVAPIVIPMAIADLQRKGRFKRLAEAFKEDCKAWRERHKKEEDS